MYPEEGLLVLPSFKTGIRGWGGDFAGACREAEATLRELG